MTIPATASPPTTKTAPKTSYHILKRLELSPPDVPINAETINRGAFVLVGRDITAASSEAAIRVYAGKAGDQAPGSYIAIPSRSFVEKTVNVETTTTVRLAGKGA